MIVVSCIWLLVVTIMDIGGCMWLYMVTGVFWGGGSGHCTVFRRGNEIVHYSVNLRIPSCEPYIAAGRHLY